jgi:hypothetical protein
LYASACDCVITADALIDTGAVLTEVFHLALSDRHGTEAVWTFIRSGALKLAKAAAGFGYCPSVGRKFQRMTNRRAQL